MEIKIILIFVVPSKSVIIPLSAGQRLLDNLEGKKKKRNTATKQKLKMLTFTENDLLA